MHAEIPINIDIFQLLPPPPILTAPSPTIAPRLRSPYHLFPRRPNSHAPAVPTASTAALPHHLFPARAPPIHSRPPEHPHARHLWPHTPNILALLVLRASPSRRRINLTFESALLTTILDSQRLRRPSPLLLPSALAGRLFCRCVAVPSFSAAVINTATRSRPRHHRPPRRHRAARSSTAYLNA
ncbi:hypothetical protein B0H19DRAFT_1270969 [Mycena capillaripes]|nr:hypothetical protein B0H19DRAFT_1270969 [Mycena capillaripes]